MFGLLVVVSNLGFEGRNLVVIVPGNCLRLTF